MDIKLRFVNQSLDGNQSEVLIYQKSLHASMAALTMAWKVIRYCGHGCNHPFVYPTTLEVGVADDHGNFSPRVAARHGQALKLVSTPTGSRRLVQAGQASASNELDVINAMERGATHVCVFRAGRMVSVKTALAPGQKAVFQYPPMLWIGVASQVVQGMPLNSAVMSAQHTELPLLGIASADIVMSGGGPGESATPYEFRLDNIVSA